MHACLQAWCGLAGARAPQKRRRLPLGQRQSAFASGLLRLGVVVAVAVLAMVVVVHLVLVVLVRHGGGLDLRNLALVCVAEAQLDQVVLLNALQECGTVLAQLKASASSGSPPNSSSIQKLANRTNATSGGANFAPWVASCAADVHVSLSPPALPSG